VGNDVIIKKYLYIGFEILYVTNVTNITFVTVVGKFSSGALMYIEKKVLTVPQAAEYCAVERMTMWRWVKAGYIHAFVTPGGHYRIRREDLLAFLEDKESSAEKSETRDTARILVVDDDEMICKVLKRMFQKERYEVDIALNGFEAGIKMLKFNPDIIILDLVMPGIDGFEVCKLIKKNPKTSHIKVLIFTGHETEENLNKAAKAGVDGFLNKTVPKRILKEVVSKLLKKSAANIIKKNSV
jgi:excisionase family DNA binding protein